MSMLLFSKSYLKKLRRIEPQNLVSLWPQNEPLGHAVSTEIVRGYNGAYTAVDLGQPGVPGSRLTSASYDGLTSFNNIHSAGFANDNKLLNPGFETLGAMPPTWANWTDVVGDGAIANEVVIVHEGVDAAKLTSGPTANTETNATMVALPVGKYRLRFWTQGDGVNDGRYHVWSAGNGYVVANNTPTGVTGAAYEMVAVEFTTTVAENVRVYLRGPAANGGIAYFDACEVRRMNGFLGDQGSIVVPAQVANVGVWTDGINRSMVKIRTSTNNYVVINRAANNTIFFSYSAGGVIVGQSTGGLTNIDFALYGITWDISAGATGEVMYYIGGVASGATDVGLGTWIGDLANTTTVIGAQDTVPDAVWSGNIGPVPCWSKALTPAQMLEASTL